MKQRNNTVRNRNGGDLCYDNVQKSANPCTERIPPYETIKKPNTNASLAFPKLSIMDGDDDDVHIDKIFADDEKMYRRRRLKRWNQKNSTLNHTSVIVLDDNNNDDDDKIRFDDSFDTLKFRGHSNREESNSSNSSGDGGGSIGIYSNEENTPQHISNSPKSNLFSPISSISPIENSQSPLARFSKATNEPSNHSSNVSHESLTSSTHNNQKDSCNPSLQISQTNVNDTFTHRDIDSVPQNITLTNNDQQKFIAIARKTTTLIQKIGSSIPVMVASYSSANSNSVAASVASTGIIYSINEEQIPSHIFGGQSSQGQRTPITVSFEINIEILKELIELICHIAGDSSTCNYLMQDGFKQQCMNSRILIKYDELLSFVRAKLKSGTSSFFPRSQWKGDVVLIKNSKSSVVERPSGLNKGSWCYSIGNSSNASMKRIEFSNLTLEETSSNRPICRLRYKILYGDWFEYFVDGSRVFQVKCTKTSVLQKIKNEKKILETQKSPLDVAKTTSHLEMISIMNNKDQFNPINPLNISLDINTSNIEHQQNNLQHNIQQQQQQQQQQQEVDPSPNLLDTKNIIESILQQLKDIECKSSDFYVKPSQGSCKGGEMVFIEIKNPKIKINSTSNLTHTNVHFGEHKAEILQFSKNSFFVKTPPNVAGKIPICISSGGFTFTDPNELFFEYTQDKQAREMNQNILKRKPESQESCSSLNLNDKSPAQKKSRISNEFENYPKLASKEILPSSSNSKSYPSSSGSNNNQGCTNNSTEMVKSGSSCVYSNCWAIVIGIGEYESQGFSSLQASVKDAILIASILQQNYGYKVFTLFNQEATKSKIFQLFEEVAEKVQPNDCILVYFAGHSYYKHFKSSLVTGYMCPYDCDDNNLTTSGISFKVLKEIHEWFLARHILFVLDSCYGGNLFKMRTGHGDCKTEIEYFARSKAVQLICASSTIQKPNEKGNPGVFSRFLVEALKVGGQLIRNRKKNYFTAEQLAVWIQEKVMAHTKGNQIPQYGKLEIGDGQYMFFPKLDSGYNPELERVLSLINIHQEYLHNMHVADIHKYPELLKLVKYKFSQVTKFYLESIQTLLRNSYLSLDSNMYINFRVNLDEILDSARHCYLAVFREFLTNDWMEYRKYYLADLNSHMIRRYNMTVKRIFILEGRKQYTSQDEIIKMMRYHSSKGVDIRVVYDTDFEDRLDIPRNFSIIDFRISHVLMKEDGYPKSCFIFNTFNIERYYSFWLHLYQRSISLSQLLKTLGINEANDIQREIPIECGIIQLPKTSSVFPDRHQVYSEDHQNNPMYQNLNPLLQKFKQKIQSFLTIKTHNPHLTAPIKQLLLEKFQKLNSFYENLLTNFFSEGILTTHSKFFDLHRFRLYEIERVCTQSYHGVIAESILDYDTTKGNAYFINETGKEIANMCWRLCTQKKIKCKRVFALKKRADRTINGKMLDLMSYHHKKSSIVYVIELGEKEIATFPSAFVVVDRCLAASNTYSYPNQTTHFEESQSNYYYMKNRLTANEEEVTQMLKLWKDLRHRALPFETFLLTKGISKLDCDPPQQEEDSNSCNRSPPSTTLGDNGGIIHVSSDSTDSPK